ncbi:Senecionine N-oxygenase, partial [Tetrabaena socialis]
TPDFGGRWVPVFEPPPARRNTQVLWPVGLTAGQLFAIVCKPTEPRPQVSPRPFYTPLDLSAPVLAMDGGTGALAGCAPLEGQALLLGLTNAALRTRSGFPYPRAAQLQHYPTGHEVQEYVMSYARHFGLYRHVLFSCRLVSLRRLVPPSPASTTASGEAAPPPPRGPGAAPPPPPPPCPACTYSPASSSGPCSACGAAHPPPPPLTEQQGPEAQQPLPATQPPSPPPQQQQHRGQGAVASAASRLRQLLGLGGRRTGSGSGSASATGSGGAATSGGGDATGSPSQAADGAGCCGGGGPRGEAGLATGSQVNPAATAHLAKPQQPQQPSRAARGDRAPAPAGTAGKRAGAGVPAAAAAAAASGGDALGGAGGAGWVALYEDLCTGRQYSLEVSYVVLSTGLYATPFIPAIRGQELYRGLQVHSKDFTDAGVAVGKSVLVVGAGKTAADIVTELTATSKAAAVTLLYRRVSGLAGGAASGR